MVYRYQIDVVVETDEPITHDARTNYQDKAKEIRLRSVSLASAFLGMPKNKIYFINTIMGEIPIILVEEDKNEEVSADPVV